MYVLDTYVISEIRKLQQADSNVAKWVNSVDADDMYISVITLMEVEKGILKLERQGEGAAFRHWFNNQVIPGFSDRTLPIDTDIALTCAKMHIPDKRKESDSLIAATALIHNMTVVTRDLKDFQRLGVELINPWEFKPHYP